MIGQIEFIIMSDNARSQNFAQILGNFIKEIPLLFVLHPTGLVCVLFCRTQ